MLPCWFIKHFTKKNGLMFMKNVEIENSAMLTIIKEAMEEGERFKIRVKGWSMYPLMRSDKEVALIAKVDPMLLKRGDIILFSVANEFVMHRIIRIADNRITTQGDGNLKAVEQMECSEVIGKVIAIYYPNGKEIAADSSFQRLYGLIWVAFKPLRRYLLGLLRRFWR